MATLMTQQPQNALNASPQVKNEGSVTFLHELEDLADTRFDQHQMRKTSSNFDTPFLDSGRIESNYAKNASRELEELINEVAPPPKPKLSDNILRKSTISNDEEAADEIK